MSEEAVAGIAETREDVAIGVELPIKGSSVHRNIRVGGREGGHPFRDGDQADQRDFLRAGPLELGGRLDSRSTSGQHRIEEEKSVLLHRSRHLEVIGDRLERVMIAKEADVADPRVRDQLDHGLDHAEPGAEDRHQRHLRRQRLAGHRFERRDHLDR